MIRAMCKAALESVVFVAILLGALQLYVEYGPTLVAECDVQIENTKGVRTCFSVDLYRMIPKNRIPAGLPAITITPTPFQKG